MRIALCLIDIQNDFLQTPSLYPAAGGIIDNACLLLNHCRDFSIPVIHIWTGVNKAVDQRMPHWKKNNKWICVEGSEGIAPPDKLKPLKTETVLYKRAYSAFTNDKFNQVLNSYRCNVLIVAGLYLHACIRTTVLDAYQHGLDVWVAEDAVSSDDPHHAAVTRRYLKNRGISFYSVKTIEYFIEKNANIDKKTRHSDEEHSTIIYEHISPVNNNVTLWKEVVAKNKDISLASKKAKQLWFVWKKTTRNERVKILKRWAELIRLNKEKLIRQVVSDIGKPIQMAREELKMGLDFLESTCSFLNYKNESIGKNTISISYRSLGTIAIITPYNNPIAVPLGKIGPALFYGNAVLWKPALVASVISKELIGLLYKAGCPKDLVALAIGNDDTAEAIMTDRYIDAVSITGSLKAGYTAQEICASRLIKLQAELGGNNASIVWPDADLKVVGKKVAQSAFKSAGQRCTANSRVIIEKSCYAAFLEYLKASTSVLVWGDPQDERTQIGPMNSTFNRDHVKAAVDRATLKGNTVCVPHEKHGNYDILVNTGCYYPPTIICCDDPSDEIVQEETFGPVLVAQKADDWDHAISLCNNVKQGLVSSLFSQSSQLQKKFIDEARSGIVKINEATSGIEPDAPFGGWKASGLGPPEHGLSDREFYTCTQTIYH